MEVGTLTGIFAFILLFIGTYFATMYRNQWNSHEED
jgi:hypothetical protein